MAGPAAPGKLRSALGTRYAAATPADDAAIRRLLRDNPMQGSVDLTFEREPDYFRGTNLAGGEDTTIVATSHSQLVCMGRCTRRECWIDGRVRRVGYLGELRLEASARGRFEILRDGYRFFRELERPDPADLYFTSIAADNARARSLLEAGVRGLPGYQFLAELDTHLVSVSSPRRITPRIQAEPVTPDILPRLVRLVNEQAQSRQLATVWTEDRIIALQNHGLPLSRFLIARKDHEIIAAGALWDQRGWRQTVIHSYAPLLGALRPMVNLVGSVFGRARLPKPSSVLAHAFLSPLAFARGSEGLLPEMIESFFPMARQSGLDFLTLALPATDPRAAEMRRRFATRSWRSRLYRVAWPDQEPCELQMACAPFLPEVALL